MKKNMIAIIGAGQIGRRHLQALKLLTVPINIQVVDLELDSLNKAKETYNESPSPEHNHIVEYFTSMDSLSSNIDLAIISTTAGVREKVVENLLKEKDVRYLLLEKVVFQHKDSFSKINLLMNEKGVKAWVNCPIRIYPFFVDLKERLTKMSPLNDHINYQISGSLWNLASNAIHHLDLFSFLSNETNFELDSSLLDSTILQSKREGFIEVTGSLLGKSDHGNSLLMTSYPKGNAPLLIQITTSNLRCIVNLNDQLAYISEQTSNWEWCQYNCPVPYQSQLTNLVVKDILDNGKCNLPTYNISWSLHIPLLHSIGIHLKKHSNWSHKSCPIS